MPDLFSFPDYREYLRALYEERKLQNSWYSYRLWANHIGLDSAQLYRILSGDMHLPLKHLESMVENIKLSKTDAEYFRTLVQWGRAKTEKEKNTLVSKLLGCRDVKRKTLSREQYLFFKEWYHSTIRSLIGAGCYNGKDDVLAKKCTPAISEKQVKDSITLQLELGLLRKEGRKVVIGDAHLSTDEKEVHKAIRGYQAQMLHIGAQALEQFDKEHRDFSTLTFAVDSRSVNDIKAILTECRRQIQRRIEESGPPDRVVHLSMNLFPTGFVGTKAPWEEQC